MLAYVIGSVFKSPARVLVNTVNTEGVMGKGIAKDFKTIYPDMFKKYQRLCETKQFTVGKLWLYKTSNKWILNFPTKITWRKPSKVEYVEKGLRAFVKGYAERGITSIAFPMLGCGNGELSWEKQVRPMMEKYLEKLPIDIFIHLYRQGKTIPEHKNIQEITAWLRSEPESLVFSEVWRDLKKIIGLGLSLKTLNEDLTFYVYVEPKDKNGVWIEYDQEKQFISYDGLMQFWNSIREYGFGIQNMTSALIAPYANFILSVFSRLTYCQVVSVSNKYDSLKSPSSLGIQVIPRSVPNHTNGILHIVPA